MTVDGVPLAILDEGPADALVTVMLLHGWGSSAATWATVISSLSAQHRVLVPDLQGHGGSGVGDEPVTIRRAVKDVWALVSATRPHRLAVVGHSLGGTIATALAMEHTVDALVVVDPSYGADRVEMAAAPARLARYRHDGPRQELANIAHAFAPDADPGLVVAARHALLASNPRALADLYASNYLDPDAIGAEPAAREWLKRRSAPTLAFYPSSSRARLDRELGATVEVWPGAGHFLHQEDPQRFTTAVLAWIDRCVR